MGRRDAARPGTVVAVAALPVVHITLGTVDPVRDSCTCTMRGLQKRQR